MTYDLQNFGLQDMIDVGRRLRTPSPRHQSMEEAAAAVVDLFHDCFRAANDPGDSQAAPNCALVRCFKTHPYSDLPPSLRQKATALLHGQTPAAGLQCLTLLATRGERPQWNSRFSSAAHQVIPLPTVQMVSQAPMIHQLILQLGMKVEHVVRPTAQGFKTQPTFDVFHVESASGSDQVPDQAEFVQPFGIQSVLGFGGLLPAGELFAVILFARVTISPETAALFRTLALGVKLALLPHSGKRVFDES